MTDQTKHTQGPWFVHETLGYAVATIGKTRIAAAVAPNGDATPDANLIAAAPDLLAACIEVSQGYSTRGSEMARAALRKAIGSAA